MGIESGDNEVLTHMNKKVSAEQNLRAVCCLNEQRIDTDCTFVVGFPGETDATLQNTIDMINRFPDNGQAFNFYHAFPFILTPLSRASSPEMRSHFSLRGGQNRWQHATMSSQEAARNVVRMFLEVQHAFSRYIATPETTFLRNTDPRHWQFLRARQKLVQGRIRGISRADEDSLWNELASAFAPTPSAKSPSDQPAPVR
jgi:tRNA A37 methylthiotransferase MiaB